MKKINIAIDGYSSCGKSTLAKALAQKLGYIYIDTGAMYRAVTLFALKSGLINGKIVNEKELIKCLPELQVYFQLNAETQKPETFLNGKNIETDIRSMEVSNLVSEISKIKEVRKKLVLLQQEMGKNKGVVMDGRDIGTVVFPDAELKLFMTADKQIRAKRRYNELLASNSKITLEEVQKNIEERDYIDTNRVNDPLKQAEDALVIDNSDITPVQQLQLALKYAQEKINPSA
jgi:CMP/dCMP kinase